MSSPYANPIVEASKRQKQVIRLLVSDSKTNWPLISRIDSRDINNWFVSQEARTIIEFMRSADVIAKDNIQSAIRNNKSAFDWFESAMDETVHHKFVENLAWLKQEAARREIQRVLQDATSLLAGGQKPVVELADMLIARMRPHTKAEKQVKSWNLDDMVDALEAALTTGATGGGTPIRLPWTGLKAIGGVTATIIRPKSLAAIVAGTGIGKTTLTLQIVLEALLSGQNVILVSNEWTPQLIFAKLAQMNLGAKAGFNVDDVISTELALSVRNIRKNAADRFNAFISSMSKEQVSKYIVGIKALREKMTGALELVSASNVTELEAGIDRWTSANPDKVVDLIVIDYIQAMAPAGATAGVTNYSQNSAPTEIANWLFRKVNDLSCAGLVVSQMTKEGSSNVNNGGKTADTAGQFFRIDPVQLALALESNGDGTAKLRVLKNNGGNAHQYISLVRDGDTGTWQEPSQDTSNTPPVPAPPAPVAANGVSPKTVVQTKSEDQATVSDLPVS